MILETIATSTGPAEVLIVDSPDDLYDKSYGHPFLITRPHMFIKEITFIEWRDYHKIDSEIKYVLADMDHNRREEKVRFFHKLSEYKMLPECYSYLIHCSATVASTAKIGHGVYIGPGARIAPYAQIGDFAFINRNATVGHHSIVENYCTLNPACNIAGCCKINQHTTIGMGANVIDHVIVGENCFIGAGSVVTKNTTKDGMFYGVPAKFIRDTKKGVS
jgi:sugar O-acyltransferase (sialic acid O-acetyltransferase NeuD family)